jgi:hypothetical protein
VADEQGAVLSVADHGFGLRVEFEDQTAGAGVSTSSLEGVGPADDAPVGSDPAPPPGVLIYAQGYTPTQERVMSSWNTGEAGGLLHSALQELRAAGWLRPAAEGVPAGVLEQQHAMAAALLIAVSALESAALQTSLSLDGADQLLGALLDGEPIPAVDEWDLAAGKA